jgi:RNA polymerase sigma-70 factor (ECF subfamily)
MRDLENLSDEELVELFRDGNEDAFTALYRRFEDRLKRLIYYYIPDADEVNDVFHDVLMRVVKHMGSFNVKKTFSSWIYQIAINCSKNHINRRRRDTTLIEKEKFRLKEEPRRNGNPENQLISKLDMQEFNRAVENLKEKQRDVFVLRYDHGMKYADIAGILECSERTAKWRMEKAVESITLFLKERGVV